MTILEQFREFWLISARGIDTRIQGVSFSFEERETSAGLGSARTPQAGTAREDAGRDFRVIGAIIAVKASHRQAVAVLGIAVSSRIIDTYYNCLRNIWKLKKAPFNKSTY
jgi:hypothetical protein